MPKVGFDPESDSYDYGSAKQRGLQAGEDGHWPSRDPETGMLLKGRRHKTFQKGVDVDRGMGYRLEKRDDGRYYTVPDFARGGSQLPRK
jgi:hypothetical protein